MLSFRFIEKKQDRISESEKWCSMNSKYSLFLDFLNKRIENHMNAIKKASEEENHEIRSLCKSDKAEAEVIRAEFLKIFNADDSEQD
jgi:hypothetical protein